MKVYNPQQLESIHRKLIMERILILLGAVAVLFMLLFFSAQPKTNPQEYLKHKVEAPKDDWFQASVVDSNKLVVVDFNADWCGPCKALAPLLHDLESEYGDQIELVEIDIDDQPELASHYRVGGIPLVLVMYKGTVVDGRTGLVSYDELEKMVKRHFGLIENLTQSQMRETEYQNHQVTAPSDDWFQSKIVDSKELVLVDFNAEWCAPCKALNPLLHDLKNEYEDQLELVEIDVDDHPELVSHYRVGGIPLVLVMHQGAVIDGRKGLVDYAELEKMVKPHFGLIENNK